MDIFNPEPRVCTVRRDGQHAAPGAATLNDPQFVEAARHLAELALANGRKDEDALQRWPGRVLSSPAERNELGIVNTNLKEMQFYYSPSGGSED